MNESIEELLSRAAGCLEAGSSAYWTFGDIVTAAVEDMRRAAASPREFRRRRSAIFGQFAALKSYVTKAFVKQHAEVAAAFGVEQRYPDVAWSLFRATLNAARRTKRDPRELLDDALAKAMSVADLNALGRDQPQMVEHHGTCSECGAEQRVRIVGSTATAFQGMPVPCAVCIGKLKQDGGDAREAATIGTLEAA